MRTRSCRPHYSLLFACTMVLNGCAGASSQGTSSGLVQGAVDLLMAGEKVTDQYSIHLTSCRHDAAAHELIFSGKEMAAFAWKTQDALRISDAGMPLKVMAYRKGQPLLFNASSCHNQAANGELNLDCRESGNHLSATIHYGQCGKQ